MNKKAKAKKGAESKCAWLYASTVALAGPLPVRPPRRCLLPNLHLWEKVKPPAGYRMAGGFAVGRARCTPAKTG